MGNSVVWYIHARGSLLYFSARLLDHVPRNYPESKVEKSVCTSSRRLFGAIVQGLTDRGILHCLTVGSRLGSGGSSEPAFQLNCHDGRLLYLLLKSQLIGTWLDLSLCALFYSLEIHSFLSIGCRSHGTPILNSIAGCVGQCWLVIGKIGELRFWNSLFAQVGSEVEQASIYARGICLIGILLTLEVQESRSLWTRSGWLRI